MAEQVNVTGGGTEGGGGFGSGMAIGLVIVVVVIVLLLMFGFNRGGGTDTAPDAEMNEGLDIPSEVDVNVEGNLTPEQ